MARKKRKPSNSRPDEPAVPITSKSDAVQVRLSRIESNYQKLDELLTDLETRVPGALPEEPVSAAPVKPR